MLLAELWETRTLKIQIESKVLLVPQSFLAGVLGVDLEMLQAPKVAGSRGDNPSLWVASLGDLESNLLLRSAERDQCAAGECDISGT